MSWSEDTRCLYCEGRLPLYRKITHGQFCSSAHRKSYWQEQERLAIERLHEAHSSLRSYRSATHHEEVQQEVAAGSTPYFEQEPSTLVAVATQSGMNLEPDPVPAFNSNPHPIPEMLCLLAPDFTALGGSSPELVAADPFEYEITLQPLQPSHAASEPKTNPLPKGSPIPVWSYLGPLVLLGSQASDAKKAAGAASVDCDVEFCHPRSGQLAAGMRAAGRVGMPLTVGVEARRSAATESSLLVLEMAATPVTSIELEVPVQSDVLLQLLDNQVPHPQGLHALSQFAAHQSTGAPACLPREQFESRGVAVTAALPSVAVSAVSGDHELDRRSELLDLSGAMLPAQGAVASRTAISEIPVVLSVSQPTWISAPMPAPRESVHEMGMAGLQSLRSHLSLPAQVVVASRSTESLAFDLAMGVSSDVTYPSLALVAAAAAPMSTRILPLIFAKKRRVAGDVPRVEPIVRLLPQAVEIPPVMPVSGLEPLDRKPPQDAMRRPQSGIGSLMRGEGLGKLEPAWAHATGFWHHAPRDLKLLLFAIPALLALVFHPGWPRVAFAAPQTSNGLTGGFTRALSNEWTNVRQTLGNRAAVALDEDFRSGLDNWASPRGSTTEWSFDATGFVRPGPLALYRPSVNLTDYHVEFVGLIDKKALSWVVRAADFENFYVIKLAIVKPGPMPVIGLTRYAVLDGKSQDRHDVNIPLSARMDTVYNVRMDVKGSEFLVEVQGQIADSWTETRLPRGGVGFFTASGEASRLRWMQITHQYDMLGRLCAYFAPYDTTNGSWQP